MHFGSVQAWSQVPWVVPIMIILFFYLMTLWSTMNQKIWCYEVPWNVTYSRHLHTHHTHIGFVCVTVLVCTLVRVCVCVHTRTHNPHSHTLTHTQQVHTTAGSYESALRRVCDALRESGRHVRSHRLSGPHDKCVAQVPNARNSKGNECYKLGASFFEGDYDGLYGPRPRGF